MNIRILSGALVLVSSVAWPGLAQHTGPAAPARAPRPSAKAAPPNVSVPAIVSVAAPVIAPPAITATPAAVAPPVVAVSAHETAPPAVVAPVVVQEPASAPAPEASPDPALAPDEPPVTGPAAPQPGAPRAGRATLPPNRPGQGPPAMGTSAPVATPRPSPAPREFVEDAGMKNQIFDVRHRDPARLEEVLQALGSGRRGSVIDSSREFKTLTVRDFPENLATIEAAIKRLDVPAPPSADIDIRLFVVLASTTPDGPVSDLPAEIRAATQQLHSAFGYKGFRLLTPILQRSREGHVPTRGAGEIAGAPLAGLVEANGGVRYNYEIRSISRVSDSSGASQIDLTGFEFEMNGRLGTARIASSLSLNPGEQVVVGSASLNRTALILILSANVVK